MRGAHIDLPQDDILPPPAENVTDDIGEELHNAAEMRLPTPTSFQTTKTGFQKFESKLRSRIFRQQQYLEVIWNHALGLGAYYQQTVAAHEDVPWPRDHNQIVNRPDAGSVANWKQTGSCLAANS